MSKLATICFYFATTFIQNVFASPLYIEVGKPNLVREIVLTEVAGSYKTELKSKVIHKLDFSDIFEVTPYKSKATKGLLLSIRLSGTLGKEAQLDLSMKHHSRRAVHRRYAIERLSLENVSDIVVDEAVQYLSDREGIFGSRILMTCKKGAHKEIYSISPTGERLIKHTVDQNIALSPAWSRDGKRIAYTSYTKSKKRRFVNPNLYLQNYSTGRRELVSSDRGMNAGASFSASNSTLVYTFSSQGKPEIYILDLFRKLRYKITNSLGFAVEPSWSPDGQEIAFSKVSGSQPHIWIAKTNGHGSRKLTNAGHYNSSPEWSPDGETIAFAGQEHRSTEFGIFTVNKRTSEIQRITHDNYSNEDPSFSPDGRFIAYSSKISGNYVVRVQSLLSGRTVVVSPRGFSECKQPAWSKGKIPFI